MVEIGAMIKKKLASTLKSVLPLTTKQEIQLRQISHLLDPEDIKLIERYMKQDLCTLNFEKSGLSFLVAHTDLRPILASDLDVVKKLNQILTKKHDAVLQKGFSERAWKILQEYFGSNVMSLRNIKQIITLLALSNPIKIKLANISKSDRQRFEAVFKELKLEFPAEFNGGKSFDFVFESRKVKSNSFSDMATKIVSDQKSPFSAAERTFLKTYIYKARALEPILSINLGEKVKNFAVTLKNKEKELKYSVKEGTIEGIIQLVKASARIELRDEVKTKDLERVFALIKN